MPLPRPEPSSSPEPEDHADSEDRREELDPISDDFAEFPDERFVPPEPPPFPIFAPATVVATAAVGFGLVTLFYPGILTSLLGASTEVALLVAVIILLSGVATLISRLRNPDPEEPTDPDSGAQV